MIERGGEKDEDQELLKCHRESEREMKFYKLFVKRKTIELLRKIDRLPDSLNLVINLLRQQETGQGE